MPASTTRHHDGEREREPQADRQRAHASLLQPVADAAHRLDRVAAERPVDLLAQVADVDVDDVRAALERHVPRAFEQLRAGQHAAGPAHEQLEQRELLRREVELVVAAPGAVRGRVEPQVADLELDRPLGRRAARERAQPREQLVERERLRRGSRRRRRRGRPRGRRPRRARSASAPASRRRLPQPPADLEAVDARQHDVEHDRVVRRGRRHPERVLAARRRRRRRSPPRGARARAAPRASARPRRRARARSPLCVRARETTMNRAHRRFISGCCTGPMPGPAAPSGTCASDGAHRRRPARAARGRGLHADLAPRACSRGTSSWACSSSRSSRSSSASTGYRFFRYYTHRRRLRARRAAAAPAAPARPDRRPLDAHVVRDRARAHRVGPGRGSCSDCTRRASSSGSARWRARPRASTGCSVRSAAISRDRGGGGRLRLLLVAGAIVVGAIAAVALLPKSAPWLHSF